MGTAQKASLVTYRSSAEDNEPKDASFSGSSPAGSFKEYDSSFKSPSFHARQTKLIGGAAAAGSKRHGYFSTAAMIESAREADPHAQDDVQRVRRCAGLLLLPDRPVSSHRIPLCTHGPHRPLSGTPPVCAPASHFCSPTAPASSCGS